VVHPQQVLFQHKGSAFASEGTFHVSFGIELTGMHETCAALLLQARELTSSPVSVTDVWLTRWAETFNSTVSSSCASLGSWPHLFRAPSPPRQKRQLLALAGTFLGGYAVHEIIATFTHSAVAEHVRRAEEKLSHLATSVRVLIARAAKEDKRRALEHRFLELTLLASEMHSTIADLTEGFRHLVSSHRLTTALLPLNSLRSFWQDLLVHLHLSAAPLPFPCEVVYELPASYRIEEDLQIILHIPSLTTAFNLYQLLDFPAHRPGLSPVIFQQPASLLAIDDSHTSFFLPTIHDLNSCLHFGKAFVCQVPYLRHDVNSACLPALFTNRWKQAAQLCPVSAIHAGWRLAPGRGDGEWYLFTTQAVTFTYRCPNGTWSAVWEKGFTRFIVPKRCAVITNLFSVPSIREEQVSLVSVIRQVSWKAFPSLNESGYVDRELEEAGKQVDLAEEKEAGVNGVYLSLWMSVAISISVVCLVSMILFLLCRLYYKAKPEE